jgi:hypothetical protein
LDLDRHATIAAHEVMVVIPAAAPVEHLSVFLNDRVGFTCVGKGLEGAVDRRKPHGRAVGDKALMQLLRRDERLDFVESADHGAALSGGSLADGDCLAGIGRRGSAW